MNFAKVYCLGGHGSAEDEAGQRVRHGDAEDAAWHRVRHGDAEDTAA